MRPDPSEDPVLDDLPPALRADLGDLLRSSAEVPDAVDRAVLAAAREHLTRPAPAPVLAHRGLRLVLLNALPAAIAAGLLLWWGLAPERSPALAPAVRVAEVDPQDLDGSGRVDVLDAFALARRLEGDARLDPAWDFDGDGRVDRTDVDRIAQRAVRIDS